MPSGSYQRAIARSSPACLVILIDHSASMQGARSERVARAVNSFIADLIIRCTRGNEVRALFDLAVIGYTTSPEGLPLVMPVWQGVLAGHDLVSVVELAEHPLEIVEERLDMPEGVRRTRRPIWYRPPSPAEMFGTPTCAALRYVTALLSNWCAAHTSSFPPTVLNMTDGEATDGDPHEAAAELQAIGTADGHVLLFHSLVTDEAAEASERMNAANEVSDSFARGLCEMSSPIPATLRATAGGRYFGNLSRGMGINIEPAELLRPLNIGTQAARPPVRDAADREESTRFPRRSPHNAPPRPDPVPSPSHPPYLDENVQFTVYRPEAMPPEKWLPLLAFAHLSDKPPDAPPDELSPVEEVQRQAGAVLGKLAADYKPMTQDSRSAVPRMGEITFVPAIPGCEFNPPRAGFRWEEPVHRAEFRVRASAQLEGQTARGQVTVFLGSIILAEISLAIRVESKTAARPRMEPSVARPYRHSFPSYSRKDREIVEQFERYGQALGDKYLRDVLTLRAGEEWNPALMRLIEDADVFQLFWSTHSMHSVICRQEWEHALSLRRESFIRPTYWEDPFPETPDKSLPPELLRKLHFHRLGLETREGHPHVPHAAPLGDAPPLSDPYATRAATPQLIPYYVRRRGQVLGPFNLEQIGTLRQRGWLADFDEVSPDRLHWKPASTLLDEVSSRSAPVSVPLDTAAHSPVRRGSKFYLWLGILLVLVILGVVLYMALR